MRSVHPTLSQPHVSAHSLNRRMGVLTQHTAHFIIFYTVMIALPDSVAKTRYAADR